MAKLTKADIIEQLAKKCKCSNAAAKSCLEALVDIIIKSLKQGKDVGLTGFGTFTISKRKARTGRNPQTGEQIRIPAKKMPRFKAGKGLKEAIA